MTQPPVQRLDAIGVDKVIDFARTIGLQGDMPRNLSISLGSTSVTPLEIAVAYGVSASGGVRMNPVAVKYVTDSMGRVLESNEPEGEQVIGADTAFLITSMMEDVVNYGTGWRAKSLGRPVAGKTGTTNEYHDAWFVGFTPKDPRHGSFDDHDSRLIVMAFAHDSRTKGNAATEIVKYFFQLHYGIEKDYRLPENLERTNFYSND